MRTGPWQGAGRAKSQSDKTRWLLQRPTGSVQVSVQLRKMLKAAEAKSEPGGKKCCRNLGIFALQLALPHPSISQLLPFEQVFLVPVPCFLCSKYDFAARKSLVTLDDLTLKERLPPGLQGILNTSQNSLGVCSSSGSLGVPSLQPIYPLSQSGRG